MRSSFKEETKQKTFRTRLTCWVIKSSPMWWIIPQHPVSWKQLWALETQYFLGDEGWLGGPARRAHCPRTPWPLLARGPPSAGPRSPLRTEDAALQRRPGPPGPWVHPPQTPSSSAANHACSRPSSGAGVHLASSPGRCSRMCAEQMPIPPNAQCHERSGFPCRSNTATGQRGPRVSPARADRKSVV